MPRQENECAQFDESEFRIAAVHLQDTALEAAEPITKPVEKAWQGLNKRNNIICSLLTASAIYILIVAGIHVTSAELALSSTFSFLTEGFS